MPSASSLMAPEKKATSFSVGGAALDRHLSAVAARAQPAGRAERAVDQSSVEIAHLEAEPPLTEIPSVGVRSFVARQVQDADIDSGNRDIGVFIGADAPYLKADIERPARLGFVGRVQADGELSVRRIDGEPLDTDRPHGHAALLGFARAVKRRGDIGAGTPVGRHRQFHLATGFGNGRGLRRHQGFRADSHQQFAGKARRDLELRRLPDRVVLLVESDLQPVWGLRGGGLDIPARIELNARSRPVKGRRLDLQPITAPADRDRNFGAVLRHVGRAARDLFGGDDRLVFPGGAVAIPLVIPFDADQLPGETRHCGPGAVRVDRDDVEFPDRVFGEVAGELRLDADYRSLGFHRKGQCALDRAAAGLAHANGHIGVEQLRRSGNFGEIDMENRLAVFIERLQPLQRQARVLACLFVGEAEEIAIERFAPACRPHGNFAFERQARGRCAVEIASVDDDFDRGADLDRLCFARQVELGAVRYEVVDEELLLGDRRALWIGEDLHRPGAAHRIFRDRQIERVPAELAAVADEAAVLDAVRAQENEGQRQLFDRGTVDVAGERCGMNGFARAIDAAFRPGEDVDRTRCGAAGNASVGKVEAGARHVEEHVVVATLSGGDRRRRHAGRAADQPGGKGCASFRIGRRRPEHLIVLRDQLQFDLCKRLGARKRTREDGKPIRACKGRHADVGHDEPLRGARIPILCKSGSGARRQHVDAGLALRQSLVDRKARHHFLVQLGLDFDAALPDQLAALVLDALLAVAVDLGQELGAREQRRDVAVADTVELELGTFRVDRDDRNAATCSRGQNEAVAGEADHRRAVLHVDVEADGRLDDFLDGGGQALPQHEFVTLAMRQAFDADFAALGFHRLRRGAIERHEGGIIGTVLQKRL